MGKKSKSKATDAPAKHAAEKNGGDAGLPFLTGGGAVDPSLASLFATSAGPVQAPQFTAQQQSATLGSGEKGRKEKEAQLAATSEEVGDEASESDERVNADQELPSDSDGESDDAREEQTKPISSKDSRRKRKRGDQDDDLEESYMRRIAKEEARERKKRSDETAKRRKVAEPDGDEGQEESEESESDGSSVADSDEGHNKEEAEEEGEDVPMPMHESLKNETPGDPAVEKSSRTIFLGNVSSTAIKSGSAKKALQTHLSSFFPTLVDSGVSTAPKIESIRFRSTAFSSTVVPKRAAYAKRELMDSTTRSTNAYVVYNTVAAARKALDLNGSVVLDRHLRVDSVAHPAKMDHRRCVFVGNLGFVDQETDEDEEGKKKKKQKEPADAEEGLWRTFTAHTTNSSSAPSNAPSNNKRKRAGTKEAVEYVRVVRDKSTRIGKGFAYVQFYDENAVEAALLLDGQKFPPLLPRKLRVSRAKRVSSKPANKRDSPHSITPFPNANGGGGVANAKKLDKQASFAGRAARMLGQAGAAKFRERGKRDSGVSAATGANGTMMQGAGSRIVFEGHRASETQRGGTGFKVKTKSRGAKARSGGKPKTRSAKRAKTWKKQKGGS